MNINCSITSKIFFEPIVCPNGNTYEKEVLQDSNLTYYPNNAMKEYI